MFCDVLVSRRRRVCLSSLISASEDIAGNREPREIIRETAYNIAIYILLKTGLGILDFYHSDWLNGARLSAHIPAVTKYGQ